MNGGVEWASDAEGNNGELRVVDNCSEILGILAVLRDDCGEFRRYSSIDLLAFWTSRSTINFGSMIVSQISLSDFDLNNDKSNCSSKGRYSKNNHSSGHELVLTKGV